jgi:RHS repeat-associated protein
VGQIVELCEGTHIYQGPGLTYPYHTIVPENNWAVKVIGGPVNVDGEAWWDTSRAEAGDPSGGTGWVMQTEAETCPVGETSDRIKPVIVPVEIWSNGKGGLSIVVQITDNSGVVSNATISGGPGRLATPLMPRPDFGPNRYASAFVDIPKGMVVNFTITASDPAGNVQVFNGSSLVSMGGQFGLARCKNPCGNNTDVSKGDPVTLGQLNFVYVLPVINLPGPGDSDINFSIVYNSQNNAKGIFGQGWSGPYQASLVVRNNLLLNGAEVTYPDGQVVLFEKQADGKFVSATDGNFDSLELVSGSYVLTRQSGQKYVFSADGLLTSLRDSNGNEIRLSYDGTRLVHVENDGGRWVNLSYEGDKVVALDGPEGKQVRFVYSGTALSMFTDARGKTWRFEYQTKNWGTLLDVNGNQYEAVDYWMSKIITPKGHASVENIYNDKGEVSEQWTGGREHLKFSRDENAKIVTVRDAYNQETKYIYDSEWRIEQIQYPDGSFESFGYDDNFNRTYWRDRNGGEWRYTYDERGNRLSEDGPLGYHRDWEYHPLFNKPVRASEKRDAVNTSTWTFEYDERGNPISICNPYDCSSISYNPRGLPETITDFAENTTTNTYDAEWDLATTTNGEGETVTFGTDAAGRVVSISSPLGNAFTFTFDPGDKLTEINGPMGYRVRYEFDANGNPSAEIDANGGRTTYTFDSSDKVQSIRNQNNITIAAYEYGAMNEVIAFTDGEGRRWTYDHDSDQRMIAMHGPLDVHITFKRDALGNILETTDAEGRVTAMFYDPLYRLVKVVENVQKGKKAQLPSANITTEFEYNLAGDPVRVIDPEGNATSYEVDLLGRTTRVLDAEGNQTYMEYTPMGNIAVLVNPREFSVRYTYDRANRLATITNQLGFVTRYAYDLDGRLSDITDALGIVTHIEYDGLGRKSALVQNFKPGQPANGQTNVRTEYEYDLVGNLTGVKDPRGYTATYVYDPAFRLRESYDFENGLTRYTYDNVDNLRSVTDANGHTNTYEVDALDRVTSITNPEGHKVSFTYNKTGALTRIVDANGKTTTFTLDGLDRVVQMVDALGGKWDYRYDRVGNIIEERDANRHLTTFVYDRVYRLVSSTDAEGNTTRFEWDQNGNLQTLFDANEHQTRFVYDAADQLISMTNAENETTRYQYNALGYQTHLVEADETVTFYGYDALYRLASVTENYKPGKPASNDTNVLTRYVYDASGNLVEFINANNKSTRFEYDGMGRLVKETNPLNRVWTYTYDPVGNLASRKDANGNTTRYSYFDDDQLKRIEYFNGTSVDFEYDRNNNLTGMRDSLGKSVWVYDALNRVVQVTDSLNRTLKIGYDAVGNRTSLDYPDGNRVTYTYYDNNWLASMTSPGGTTTYERDGVGNITLIQNPNSTRTTIVYDKVNRTVNLVNEQLAGAAKINSAFEYTYNDIGHVTSVTATYASQGLSWENGRRVGWQKRVEVTENYAYDSLHRLASAGRTGKQTGGSGQSTEIIGWQMSYAYDAVGNRTRWQTDDNPFTAAPRDGFSATYKYNAANQLTQAVIDARKSSDSMTIDYKYDNNGNRASKLVTPRNGLRSGVLYAYDPENRLVSVQDVQDGGGKRIYRAVTTLAYDGMGRRLAQTYDPKIGAGGAKRVEYTFDGLDPVVEYRMWNGQRDNFYRGAMGHISMMQRFPSGTEGQMYWYDYNNKHDVVGLSKQDGQSIHNYQYEPYGGVIPQTGNFTDPHNHYTLTGKETDENTGLVYFGARHYDPQSAQWMTQDTYRGAALLPISKHRYNYVYSNPISYWDWFGYATQGEIDRVKPIVQDLAKIYSVPEESIAIILELENKGGISGGGRCPTGVPNNYCRQMKQFANYYFSLTGITHACSGGDCSVGLGNVKVGTAKDISKYFAENYKNTQMANLVSYSDDIDLINKLVNDKYSTVFVAANIRMALDQMEKEKQMCINITDDKIIARLAQHHNSSAYSKASQSYYDDAKLVLDRAKRGDMQLQFLDLGIRTNTMIPGVSTTMNLKLSTLSANMDTKIIQQNIMNGTLKPGVYNENGITIQVIQDGNNWTITTVSSY